MLPARWCAASSALLVLLILASKTAWSEGEPVPRTSPPQAREGFGEPLPDLTDEQRSRFQAGKAAFERVFTPRTGLGAVFNAQSCAECHAQPATGGAHETITITRFRTPLSLNFAAGLVTQASGSPHIQSRSVADEFPDEVPNCELAPEAVPESALAETVRVTPPLFGLGLIEAIPDSTLIENGFASADRHPDVNGRGADPSVTGRAGLLFPGGINDLGSLGRLVGRFGARGFVADIPSFTQGAYRTEMGIATPHPLFFLSARPHGTFAPSDCTPFSGTAVSLAEIREVVDYMRFLAPPPRGPITPAVERGETVFSDIGCASCHTPTLETDGNTVAALSYRDVPLYSDLLLHDMGEALSDGAPEGLGTSREWRTTPLWGIGGMAKPLMHDGRAGRDFVRAIELHGGEAAGTRSQFNDLPVADKRALVRFLESL